MKNAVKILIAIAICAAIIFAAYNYMKKSSSSKRGGGPGGRPGMSAAPSAGGGPQGQGGQGGNGQGTPAPNGSNPGAPAANNGAANGGQATNAPQGQGGKGGPAQGGRAGGQGGGSPFGGASVFSQNAISVRTLTAALTPLQDYVSTTGEIEPTSSIDVFPDIGGKIQSVSTSLGAYVKKGSQLMKINPSTPGTQYSLNTVYAPISGTVTALNVKPGNTVMGSTVVVTIGNVDELQITASVPERNVASLKKGLKADITLEAYPEQIFKATVVSLSPVVDSSSRTKSVTLEFDKKDKRINAGMFAKVKLYTDLYSDCPIIPETAVLQKSNIRYIYVVNADGSTVGQRTVTLGHSVDGYVQLTSGVSVGEKMIIEGMNSLGEGTSIREVSGSSSGNSTKEANKSNKNN